MNSIITKGTSVLNTPLNLTRKVKGMSGKPSETQKDEILLADNFFKKGDFVQSWKNRYFALTKEEKDDKVLFSISYYTGTNMKEKKGTIHPIKSVELITSASSKRNPKDSGLIIGTGGSRSYFLSTPDSTVVNKWFDTLTKILEEIDYGDEQTEVLSDNTVEGDTNNTADEVLNEEMTQNDIESDEDSALESSNRDMEKDSSTESDDEGKQRTRLSSNEENFFNSTSDDEDDRDQGSDNDKDGNTHRNSSIKMNENFFQSDDDDESTDSDDWVKVDADDADADQEKEKEKEKVESESSTSGLLGFIEKTWANVERQGSNARNSRRGNNQKTESSSNSTPHSVTEDLETKGDSVSSSTVFASNSASQPELPPDTAPLDSIDPSQPIDIESTLFSRKEIDKFFHKDRVERINTNTSKYHTLKSLDNCDDLKLNNDSSVEAVLKENNDDHVHFSAILKVTWRGKIMDFIIALTSQSLLLLLKKEASSLVDANPLNVVPLTSTFTAPIGRAVFNTLNNLNPLEITKKKVVYELKERIDIRDLSAILLSQSPEQSNLLSLLLPLRETDMIMDFSSAPTRKDQFIQYLISLYNASMKKKMEYITVFNISDFTRTSKGEVKGTPVSVEDDEKVISSSYDFYKVTEKLAWCTKFKQYGELKILFSQLVEKIDSQSSTAKNEPNLLLVLTKTALFACSTEEEGVVKRRIERSDIDHLGIESESNLVLISVPSEYDLLVEIPNADEFIEAFENIRVKSYNNVANSAKFSKAEYNKKEKLMNEPSFIRECLLKETAELNRYKINLFVERAIANHMEDEDEVRYAQKILKEMDDAALLRKEWNKAWRELNLSYMRVLLKRAHNCSLMRDFEKENERKLNKLINMRILTQKMQDVLDIPLESINETTQLNTEKVDYIMQILTRAGLNDFKNDFIRSIDLKNQTIELVKKAKEMRDLNDRDGLLLIRESAKRMDILSHPAFSNLEVDIDSLSKDDISRKLINEAIESALDEDNSSALAEILKNDEYKKFDLLYKKAEDVKQYIEKRAALNKDFEIYFSTKDFGQLQRLVLETKDDDYFDRQRERAENIIRSEAKQKEQISKLRESFKTVLNKCKVNENEILEKSLQEAIEKVRHVKELEPQIKAAEVLLLNRRKKREEERNAQKRNEVSLVVSCCEEVEKLVVDSEAFTSGPFVQDTFTTACQVLDLRSELEDAIVKKKKTLIQNIMNEQKHLLNADDPLLVEAAKLLEHISEQERMKKDLEDLLLRNSPSSEVHNYILANSHRMEEELRLKANAILETLLETGANIRDRISELNNIIRNWNKYSALVITIDDPANPINIALQAAKPYAAQNAEIQSLIQVITTRISNPNKDDLAEKLNKNKSTLSSNPYINDIHQHVLSILKSCDESRMTAEGKFRVEVSQNRNLLSKIYQIITHRVKSYFFRERTFLDICKSLQMQGTQYAIRSFEASSPPLKDPNEYSYNFFLFIVENDYFTHCMQELFMSGQYIAKCYNPDSIIFNERSREELLTVFMLMNQFTFQTSVETKTSENIIADPTTLLKQTIHDIVSYYKTLFERNSTLEFSEFISSLNEENRIEIARLVEKLSNYFGEILQNSMKSNLLNKATPWGMIQKIAQQRELDAVIDIGGVSLPEIVKNVKEIVRLNLQDPISSHNRTSELCVFVSYALNCHQLGNVIRSILNDSTLPKYYTGNHAQVFQQETRDILFCLRFLDDLPFHLPL